MKLPLLTGRQVLAALQRLGFVEIDRRGSHVKLEHPDGRRIVFPYHREVDRYQGVRSMRYTQSCGGFSLAPSEGERAGERGSSVSSIPRSWQ